MNKYKNEKKKNDCTRCGGSGNLRITDEVVVTCPVCKGTGEKR